MEYMQRLDTEAQAMFANGVRSGEIQQAFYDDGII